MPASKVSFPDDDVIDESMPMYEGAASILETLPRGHRLHPSDLDLLGDAFRGVSARVMSVVLARDSVTSRVGAVVRQCPYHEIEPVCLMGPLDGFDEQLSSFVRMLAATVGITRQTQRRFRAWAIAGGEIQSAADYFKRRRRNGVPPSAEERGRFAAALDLLTEFWKETILEARRGALKHLDAKVPRVVCRGQNTLVDALEDVKEELARCEATGFVPAMPGNLQMLDSENSLK